jgi:glutathione peroxidase
MKLLLTYLILVMTTASSLYDFKMNALDGKPIDFSAYKGKTLLIVNVASKCGNTPQYADLQKLQETYGVTFQMFEKISVKGNDQHALYAWLKEKTGSEPTWNFCKYLVKPDGTVKFFASKVQPLDKQITDEL